jgi:hypothetical protein|tara:strand:- start:278 stop:565 length:288 start_codon:yes stop_codon:yes gene_type:complete
MANAPSKNIKSVNRWSPNPAPLTADGLTDYLFNELNRLGDIIFNLDTFRLEPTHSAPDKPRDGDIRYADGTSWNPGSGRGIYAYIDDGSPAWEKL